ncbi:MAG: hypothetical protein M0Z77_00740 [Thermoplasmatales archaeon]|nr:hypothetical protein [Thermoplasmatales archaeon]
MDEVIEWLLIRARAKEILSISESKEYSEILNGSIYIPFRLQYGVMDSETLKDIMDSLIQGLHDKKTEIVRAVKDMISQWNRDNQENQIEL